MAAQDVHMDSFASLVNDFISSESASVSECAAQICSLKSSASFKSLLDVVECLSSSLTDTKVETRAKGTSLLAELMHRRKCNLDENQEEDFKRADYRETPACLIIFSTLCLKNRTSDDMMSKQEMETFVIFFCDRMRDHHSIQPLVIYGFLGLISYHDVSDELIIKMLQSLFSEVHVQSLVQADRRNVFNLFSNLLKTKMYVLKSFSADFVLAFIQAMDSERDPRNLLICFKNSRLVLEHLDYSIFVEDFFEVLSCYFPVDFTPPKDEQFLITKEDLVLSLRRCFAVTESFAPYAIPLYLDKLSSDVAGAKKDSIITFTECLKIYSPEHVEIFLNDIWLLIRKDYLLSETNELSSLYLNFVYQLLTCLSKSKENEHIVKLVGLLIKDCLQTLKDPDMIIAVQCGEIIHSASIASYFIFEQIISSDLIPSLESSLHKYSSTMQRLNLLEFVVKIFAVNVNYQKQNEVLENFIDKTLPLLYEMLPNFENTKLQVLAFTCLENVLKMADTLVAVDWDVFVQHLFGLVQKHKCPSEVIIVYARICECMAMQLPDLLRKHFLASIQNNLTDVHVAKQCISLLKSCCVNTIFVEDILKFLVSTLHMLQETSNDLVEPLLHSITSILSESKQYFVVSAVFTHVINYLFSVKSSTNETWLVIGTCLSAAFKRLPENEQEQLFSVAITLIANTDLSDNICKLGLTCNFERSDKCGEIIVLCRSILSEIHKENLLGCNMKYLLTEIFKLCINMESNSFMLEQLCVTIASIVNKVPESYVYVFDEIQTNLSSKQFLTANVITLCWLTKALVLNWQKSTFACIELLVQCLKEESTGNCAADGFEIITREQEGVLNKESGAVIKLMHKQRFAQFVLPLLIENYHNSGETVKASFMTAISVTLQAMPKQLLQKHLTTLMPLLMHSLVTFEADQIIQSTLSTILSVLEHNKDVVMEYISSLIARLLSLVTHVKMNIRIICLQCLYELSTFPTYLVRPLKGDVLRNVRPALDDRKRLVRKEAVRCSNAWHMLVDHST